jgi:hypothetical protein
MEATNCGNNRTYLLELLSKHHDACESMIISRMQRIMFMSYFDETGYRSKGKNFFDHVDGTEEVLESFHF